MGKLTDEREQAIRYMDSLARQLAREGKMDECAVLHAASNLLETLARSQNTPDTQGR